MHNQPVKYLASKKKAAELEMTCSAKNSKDTTRVSETGNIYLNI